MIRKTSTIIVLTLFLSACCEKEGSFLNTIIKNHAAKIAAATQQEALIGQESSTLNANAAAIPVESTLTSLFKSNKNNAANKEVESEALTIEKTVIKAVTQPKEPSKEDIGEQVSVVAEGSDNIELKATESFENPNQQQTIAKLEISDIDISLQDQLSTKSEVVEIKAENTEVITDIAQDLPSIQIEEAIEQIIDQSPSLNEELSNDDQNVIAAIEKSEQKNIQVEQSLTNERSETKIANDDKKKKLSELVSLLNEEDNTAIEDVIKQAKAEELASGDDSKFDRNKRLLKLLSKDIKQQAEKPNSKISQQSLELLNDLLSD